MAKSKRHRMYTKNGMCRFCKQHESQIGDLCHECDYWIRQINIKPENRVVVKGVHFRISKSETFKGFGGRVVLIAFKDGRTITTNNLWCQGDIPERFRRYLPDNAEIVDLEIVDP